MTSTGGFDAAVQVRRSLVENVLLRLMSDPGISSQIPSQERLGAISFWWETPRLALVDGDAFVLTVDLHAGFREASSSRIFSLNGPAHVRLVPQVIPAGMSMPSSGPALSLLLAGADGHRPVDLSNMQISYAGLTPPPPEISSQIASEIDSLAGVLTNALRGQLNTLRETVPPMALPSSLVGVRGQSSLSVALVGAHTFGPVTGDVIAVGASLTGGTGVATAMTDVLAAHPASNVAITALDTAINRTVASVLGAGLFFMDGSHTLRLARLQHLALSFQPGVIQASGHITPPSSGNSDGDLLLTNFAGASFSLTLSPSITVPGQLVLTPGSANIQLDAAPRIAADLTAEAVGDLASALTLGIVPPGVGAVASEVTQSAVVPAELTNALHDPANWSQIMSAVFGGAYHAPTGTGFGFVDVSQHVPIPGTTIAFDIVPNGVVVGAGELSLFAAVRQPNVFFQPHAPDLRPVATINQPEIPTQTTELAPVTAEVHAEVMTSSYDPYDFTWTTDLPHHTRTFGPDLAVTGSPHGAGPGGDLEIITNAHLTVIDSFGQIQHTMAPVYANAAQRRVPGRLAVLPSGLSDGGNSGRGMRFLIPAILLVLLALVAASAYGAYHLGAFGGTTSSQGLNPISGLVPTVEPTASATVALAATPTAMPTVAPTATRPPAGSPPVFAFQATPGSISQACSGIQALQPFTVTLDNSHSTMAVSWQVQTMDTAPNGSEYWAYPAKSGQAGSPTVPLLTGTVAAGALQAVTITSAADLCQQLQSGSGAPVTYNVDVQTTSAGAYSATIHDAVAPPIPG